ncbi:MAG TPA: hypothetical protein VF314_11460 [Actinomycetes bacterium]
MTDAGPSRRAVLVGGGLLALGACTTGGGPVPRPTPRPDDLLRAEVTSAVQALADLYAATLVVHPTLAARLGPLAAEHRSHLDALLDGAPRPTPSTSSGTPSTGASPSTAAPSTGAPPTGPSAVPRTPAAAVSRLAAAERRAAGERVGQAVRATAPELARLVAAVGACEAAHAALLGATR